MAKRNKILEAQKHIDGNEVAHMILDFHQEFRGRYPFSVMASDLCAVGPLQAMIGLAIANGRLYTQQDIDAVWARVSS